MRWRKILVVVLIAIASGALFSIGRPAENVEQYRLVSRQLDGQRNARRPSPETESRFIVGGKTINAPRQGSAFVVDPRGYWATAGHVTAGCARLRLLVNGFPGPPILGFRQAALADISLVTGGQAAPRALAIAGPVPETGAVGFHMGFPMGTASIVGSSFIGTAEADYRPGGKVPVLVWAQDWRTPDHDLTLEGLSGGPVLDVDGKVAGIVSAVAERRGRILTTRPAPLRAWLAAEKAGAEGLYSAPVRDRKEAISRLQLLLRQGLVRQIYCET